MVWNCSSASVGELVCGRAAVSATQPVAGPVIANGFFSTAEDTCRTEAMRADRRQRRQPLADLRFGLGRHQIAAVLAGAVGHRLGVERAQRAVVAGAHIGLEGRLVLDRRSAAAVAAQRRPQLLQRQLRRARLLLVERAGCGRPFRVVTTSAPSLRLDLGQPLVVGFLEGFEGAL